MRRRGVMNRLWMRMRRAVHSAAVHAGAPAIAFGAGAAAIVNRVRVLLRTWIAGVLNAAIAADLSVIAVVAAVGLVLDAAVATNLSVIAIVATVGLVLDAAIAADQPVITIVTAVGWVLHAAIASNQAMIAIVAAVRLVGPVMMWAVRTVRVRTPRVIVVVVSAVPAAIVDVSGVVVDHRAAASAAPIAAPCAPTPTKAAAHVATASADYRPDRDARAE